MTLLFETASQSVQPSLDTLLHDDRDASLPGEGVVHSSDNIEVLWRHGRSDYLVVSFGTKNEVANGEFYWLKAVAEKADISVIGFMPRTSSWYPQAEVESAVQAIGDILRAYKKIIVIGTSMGGYAALKHSARLGATHVLSFAPQYSIDPADVSYFDKRFAVWFQSELHAGMAIREDDVQGTAYVFYDPIYGDDRENVRLIRQAAPAVVEVPLPFTTHFPIMLFRGTQPMVDLFEMCLAGDSHGLATTARRVRRSAAVRIMTVCKAYAKRNPEAAKTLFDRRLEQFKPGEILEFHMLVAKEALAAQKLDLAQDMIEALLETAPDDKAALVLAGKIYLAQKNLPKALLNAYKMVDYFPQDASTLNDAALIMVHAGTLDEAEATLKKAVDLVPERSGLLGPGILRRLSAVYIRKRQPTEALAPALKAIEMAPGVAAYHAHLSEVWLQLGRFADARDAAKAALALDPDDKNAQTRLAAADRKLEAGPVAVSTARKAKAKPKSRPDTKVTTMTPVLFFTCADAGYEDFAPLYIASALWSVPKARAEVGLVSADAFARANPDAIRVLHEQFGDRFVLRDVPWQRDGKKVLPHTVRFLNEPLTHADNIYIGDIDIIYLDRTFPAQHLEFMASMGLPYANSRRTGTGRMTGLHFAKWEAMYPLPDLSDINLLRENDENVLGMICDRKGLPQHDKMWRPVPGIHVSPNREPISVADADGKRKPDWGIRNWVAAYDEFRKSTLMQELYPHLKGKARAAIDAIDNALAASAKTPELAAGRHTGAT